MSTPDSAPADLPDLLVVGSGFFGLTIAESMACGVAPVAMDFSAVSEVVGPGGKLVPVDYTYDNEYDHQWARPKEPEFAEAVVRLATHASERRELGMAATRHIAASFSWDRTAAGFATLIEEAIAEVPEQEHAGVR